MKSSLPLWRGLSRLVRCPTELHQHARLLTLQVFNHPAAIAAAPLTNCYYSTDRGCRASQHISSPNIAPGPLPSHHCPTDWESGTSQHTSSSQLVGITTVLGLGLMVCSNSRGMHRNYGLVLKVADIIRTFLFSVSFSEDERRFVIAAKEGDVSTIKRLLDSGVDVNCRHPLGWTALHTAIINGHKRYILNACTLVRN